MTIEVLLADDRDIIRSGMRRLLGFDPEISVVGEAETLADTLRMAEQLKPHLVIMDLYMTQADRATKQLAEQISKSIPRWIAVSFANDDAAKQLAASVGALKLLDKISLSDDLIPAIRSHAPNADATAAA
jgi:DNA-binding NarL/FixJ family response regulator